MKGLILAAGRGTRLRPITSLRPKPTSHVANRPLIHYAVENLVATGIRDIGVVVSYDTINTLKDTLDGYGQGVRYSYLIQDPPRGLAHAVQVSREFLGDDPFVMYLSDNLFEHGIGSFVESFDPEAGVNAVLALVPVEDPRAFGVAEVDNGSLELPSLFYSYLGFGIANRERRTREGIDLCRHACRLSFYEPENYLNLARACLLAGNRAEAYRAIEKGYTLDSSDPGLRQLHSKLGVRRRPILGFLERRHPINRLLGRFRHSVGSGSALAAC